MSVLTVPALEPDGEHWPSLGPLVCAWMEERLVFGPGDLLGQPYRLDEEKQFLIWRAYEVYPPGHEQAGRRRFKRVGWSLRKGSAKTELMAAVAAAELSPDAPVRCDGFRKNGSLIWRPVGNPYIPLCAYTEDQVEELAYGALREMLMRSKDADRYDIGLERIIRIGKGGREDGKCQPVASAPSARDGARTTFQGFDESHRFTTPPLRRAHQTMLQNVPKRKLSDAWSLETTTAFGPGEHSVAEATYNYAKAVHEGRLKDSRLFFFHRQASDGHDLTDRKQRRAAVIEASGPAAGWSSIEEITDQYDDPTVDKTYWERVWLNRPVKAAEKAFKVDAWKERAFEPAGYRPPRGAVIVMGFDGARSDDSTGLIGCEVETGILFRLGLWEKPPGEPAPDAKAWEVPLDEVDQAVADAFATWTVWRFYADPPYWETPVADWAGRYGDEVVVYFLTRLHTKMAYSIRGFTNAITDGSLRHDGDADLARHIGNAHKRNLVGRDEEGKPLYVIQKWRPHAPEKIDMAVAAVLAWQARCDALAEGIGKPEEPSVYETRGMLTV